MNAEDLEKFRKRLVAEREAVVSEVETHSQGITETTDEVEIAIVESDENLVEKIDFALKQIADGNYGICISCGNSIPLARLDAKPAVSLCAPCQEAKEQS